RARDHGRRPGHRFVLTRFWGGARFRYVIVVRHRCQASEQSRGKERVVSNIEQAPAESAAPDTARVEGRDITKGYGRVVALRGVNMEVHSGEIAGFVGANGAGKSTLVNIMAGALPPTSGTVLVDGREVSFRTPIDARKAGIETVYQDLALASDL